MTETPDPGLTDLIAAHWYNTSTCMCTCGWSTRHLPESDDDTRIGILVARHLALVVEQHTNGRIAELEAALEKYHAEERRELEWDRFCAQQDVRCTECGLRYGERKDYTCPHIGEHKYDADELRAALEGEQQ